MAHRRSCPLFITLFSSIIVPNPHQALTRFFFVYHTLEDGKMENSGRGEAGRQSSHIK